MYPRSLSLPVYAGYQSSSSDTDVLALVFAQDGVIACGFEESEPGARVKNRPPLLPAPVEPRVCRVRSACRGAELLRCGAQSETLRDRQARAAR